jgi:hypothetical protein
MRLLPFLKPTKGVQIAGGGFPDSGGGGGSYTLPPATDTTLGGVKIGSGVNVTSDGTISVNGGGSYTLPPATSETLGGIKVGSRLSVESDGTLSATDQSYTLPTASASTLGGVKVGTGLSITDGVLSATGTGGISDAGYYNGFEAFAFSEATYINLTALVSLLPTSTFTITSASYWNTTTNWWTSIDLTTNAPTVTHTGLQAKVEFADLKLTTGWYYMRIEVTIS